MPLSRFRRRTSVLKRPRQSTPDDAKFAPPEEMLQEIWETPHKEMPE
jgi:hypothetical protein